MSKSKDTSGLDPLIAAARAAAQEIGASPPQAMPAEEGLSPELAAGQIQGYRLLGEIHRGGQGVVFRALQESTGRAVAIKVLRRGPLAGEHQVARFEREVHLLASLQHENIVAIHESGSTEGCHYFVMDYVPGQTLDAFVEGRGLTVRETLELFLPICRAVEAAHLRGILHRDLKPSNVRVDPDGRPWVLDFGLAKTVTGAGLMDPEGLTQSGQFVGSLPWASPEQTRQDPDSLDLRSDVYSLGVVLYQMLTGEFPYEVTGNLVDVLRNIAEVAPTPASHYRLGLDEDVETLLQKCLRKERDRRYQGAGELTRDVAAYLAGEPIQAKGDDSAYLLRKALGKHRGAALAAAGYVVLVTAASLALLSAWNSASRDRDRAQQASVAAQEAQAQAEHERLRLERSQYFHAMNSAQAALGEENGGRARRLLEEADPALRGFEWRHLSWRRDRSRQSLAGHSENVTDLAYSADGAYLASASTDGSLRVWHVRSGYERCQVPDAGISWRAVALPGSGEELVALSAEGGLFVFDAASGKTLRTLVPNGSQTSAVAPLLGGRWVLGTQDGRVQLVDSGGAERGSWKVSDAPIQSLDPRPQGDTVLVGDKAGRLIEWELATDRRTFEYPGHEGSVHAARWSLDGERLASGGSDGELRIWRRGQAQPLRQMGGHGEWIFDLAWSAGDAKLISSGADHSPKIWSAESGQLLATLRGHGDRVYSVAADPMGRGWASGSRDSSIRLWPAEVNAEARHLPGHGSQVWSLAFSPDGQELASASSDGSVRIWNPRDARVAPRVPIKGIPQQACAWSPNGRVLASADTSGTVQLVDAGDGETLRRLKQHAGRVVRLCFDPGGESLLSAGVDGQVILWDVSRGEARWIRTGFRGAPFDAALSPDGERILVGTSGGQIQVLASGNGDVVHTADAHAGAIWGLAWSASDSCYVTAGNDGTLRVWDTKEHSPRLVLEGHRDAVRCVTISADGTRIASGGWDRSVRLWDVESGALALTLFGHASRVEAVAFDSQGTCLASSSVDGEVFVWDTDEGRNR